MYMYNSTMSVFVCSMVLGIGNGPDDGFGQWVGMTLGPWDDTRSYGIDLLLSCKQKQTVFIFGVEDPLFLFWDTGYRSFALSVLLAIFLMESRFEVISLSN